MNRAEFLQRFHHIRSVEAEPDFPLNRQGRPAAVLIPLIERDNRLMVLLTERAHHLRHHPGQISFPGGGMENADTDLVAAAKREALEEIGLPPEYVNVVGAMPPYRTISGYQVTPVVGLIEQDFALNLDANEVASAFEVPLDHLINRRNHLVHQSYRFGQSHAIYFIPWQERMIWGATAAMLRTLSFHLTP